MRETERVVITGMGVVSPNGLGRDAFWRACARGESGTGPITLFDASDLDCRVAGEVKGFDVEANLPAKTRRYGMRVVAMTLAATPESANDATN